MTDGRSTDHQSLIEKAAHRLPSGQCREGRHSQKAEPSVVDDGQQARLRNRSTSKSVTINQSALSEKGIISADNLRTRTTEEFRIIKRGLLRRYTRNGADRQNLVLITSAVPGEGKSFFALNIAMSIALEEDYRVLLVDCDLTNPTVMRTLGIKAQMGLIDVLTEQRLDLADVLVQTDIDGLSILPPGTPHARSAEILGSKKMGNLMNEMAHRYNDRIVIFDAPPVLMLAETSALAAHVGQIVFVIASEKTPRSTAKEALDLIGDNQNINLVLNRTRKSLVTAQFGNDYSKYYGNNGK